MCVGMSTSRPFQPKQSPSYVQSGRRFPEISCICRNVSSDVAVPELLDVEIEGMPTHYQ